MTRALSCRYCKGAFAAYPKSASVCKDIGGTGEADDT